MTSETITVKSHAARVNGIGVLSRVEPMSTAPLAPERALSYLRELQPDARDVAVIGPDGVLLAGDEGSPAAAARELIAAGDDCSRAGSVLAVASGGHAVAASLPDALTGLAEYDLAAVASAVAASFAG